LNHGRKATDDAARRQIHGLDGVACLGEYELIFRPRRPARRSRPPPKGMPSGLSFANTPYIWCDSTVVVPRMVLYTSNWLDEAFVAVTTSIFSVMSRHGERNSVGCHMHPRARRLSSYGEDLQIVVRNWVYFMVLQVHED
jgi:hypothetical protein